MGKINISIWSDLQTFLLKAHPVGSYYWSNDPTNPSELFGGTWTQIKGRFVWAKEDSQLINGLGGAKNVTLTEEQLPVVNAVVHYSSEGPISLNGGTKSGRQLSVTGNTAATWNEVYATFGGGKAHENMPPYISSYCWRRTS